MNGKLPIHAAKDTLKLAASQSRNWLDPRCRQFAS